MALPNVINEINTIKSTYLPLSGGIMSGYIKSTNSIFLAGNNNTSRRHICSGTAYNKGGFICLDGCEIEETSNYIKGQFRIGAHNGTTNKELVGKPDGTLTWGGNNVITSAGGTINGTLVLTKSTNIGNVGVLSIGNGDWVFPALLSNTNSGFYAISGNSPNQAGEFICRANKDNSNFIDLTGRPDGTLTWGATHVVRITASWKSGTNWYRKYSDGWIEQGGYVYCGSHGTWLSYHLPFSDTGYYLNANAGEGTNGVRFVSFYSRNTTGAGMYTGDDSSFNSANLYWYACGY